MCLGCFQGQDGLVLRATAGGAGAAAFNTARIGEVGNNKKGFGGRREGGGDVELMGCNYVICGM